MKELLQIEWLKLKNYNTIKVLFVLMIVAYIGVGFFGRKFESNATNDFNEIAKFIKSPFAFPYVWNSGAFISSFMHIFPALIVITLVSNEFTFKTSRQNIIDGLSRQEFITVKFMMCILIALFSTVIVGIVAFVTGITQVNPISFEGIGDLGYFFLQAVMYNLFALLFVVLVKRSVISMGLYLLYAYIGENILGGLISMPWKKQTISTYLPLNSTDSLLKFEYFSESMPAFNTDIDIPLHLIVACAYGFTIMWVIYRKFTSEDL